MSADDRVCRECGHRIKAQYVGNLRLRVLTCPRCDRPLGGPTTLPRLIHAETGEPLHPDDIKRYMPAQPRWWDSIDEGVLMILFPAVLAILAILGLGALAAIILFGALVWLVAQ